MTEESTEKFQQLLLCLEAYADHHGIQVLYIDNLNDLTDTMLDEPVYATNIVVDSFGVILIPHDAP